MTDLNSNSSIIALSVDNKQNCTIITPLHAWLNALKTSIDRGSRSEMFFKIGFLKNFANFTRKSCGPTLLKQTPSQVFYCLICEIFKNTFFYTVPPEAISV